MQPINALDTKVPNNELASYSPKPKGAMKKPSSELTVPDITAVSQPNSMPPKAATNVNSVM